MARQNYDLFIFSFFAHDSSVIWHKSNRNSVMAPRRWLFFTTAHHQIPWRELAKKTLSIVENQITSPFPLAHPSMTIAVCPIRSRSL